MIWQAILQRDLLQLILSFRRAARARISLLLSKAPILILIVILAMMVIFGPGLGAD